MALREEDQKPSDPLLTTAYWAMLALAIVALLLGGLLLLLVLGADRRSGWDLQGLFGPLWYVVLSWIYLDILGQARWWPEEPKPLPWLIGAGVAGFVSLVLFMAPFFQMPHGPGLIFFVPFAIGCLAFVAVCRIVLERVRQGFG